MTDDPAPQHCCDDMRRHLAFRCDMHPEVASCGDYLIGYLPEFDEYGIWVHDSEPGTAAQSKVTIEFCPFCGSALPPSRREEWFEILGAQDLESEDAPAEMRRYGWWL